MKSFPRIAAVTFDVGGTLIAPWPSVGDVYARVAGEFGPPVPAMALNRRFAAAWKQRGKFNHSRSAWKELVNETFDGLIDKPITEECFDAIYARFAEPAAWHVFDDVAPTLKELHRRDLKLGIISNWDERLRPLLDCLGLSDYFHAIVISHELGYAKPTPEIFHHAAQTLGTPPDTLLHVGDSADEDLAGARSAGLHAVIVNRRGGADKSEIASLSALVRLLEATI
jgi:putative hydrolase of the HAD superfamily